MNQRRSRGRLQLGAAFDDVLVAARAGAPWALERLFETLSRPVAGYLRALGAAEPDELANDVFLRVFTNLGGFTGGEDRFRSWVFTIAHHRLVDERRRAQRRPVTNGLGPADDAARGDVEEEALGRLGAEWVHRELAALGADQREVLLLRIVADLTVEQVAEVVGKSPARSRRCNAGVSTPCEDGWRESPYPYELLRRSPG